MGGTGSMPTSGRSATASTKAARTGSGAAQARRVGIRHFSIPSRILDRACLCGSVGEAKRTVTRSGKHTEDG